ncbi:MAG: DUF2330 domain-containing protein [Acidimicrobiales bacterium]
MRTRSARGVDARHDSSRRARATAPRIVAAALVATAIVAAVAAPAGACGGLVGENGTIRLERTATLAAYHDGVERYVTSFEFSGEGKAVGSIVPLPDVPTDVVRGGDWTLQRLEREVAPPLRKGFATADAAVASSTGAEVLLQTQVDALDITILKGGGDEVGKWALDNGFFLSPDAPEVLDYYASRSPIFMAAKFDASRAAALGQTNGQGTPIMLTIPTSEPWVPVRILALGLDRSEQVQADVFLLTDDKPKLLAGGKGLAIDRSEAASSLLLSDLRSDKGMGWVPDSMWLSYLKVDAQAGDLGYDLAISHDGKTLPSIERADISAPKARVIEAPGPGRPLWPIGVGLATGAVVLVAVLVSRRHRTGPAMPLGGAS